MVFAVVNFNALHDVRRLFVSAGRGTSTGLVEQR